MSFTIQLVLSYSVALLMMTTMLGLHNHAVGTSRRNQDESSALEQSFRPPTTFTSKQETAQQQQSHVLKPPFRIVQVGVPRTGSTFQFQLLSAIAHLKSPPSLEIAEGTRSADLPRAMINNTSFVFKTHLTKTQFLNELQQEGKVAVFASGNSKRNHAPFARYIQTKDRLLNCSLCEVDNYQPIFGLFDEEVTLLKHHMSLYEKIRRCCGMQMSKYQMLRLNGCNVTKYMTRDDYPWCEREDMHAVELDFDAAPIPYVVNDPEYNWAKPGDCARFDERIQSGIAFNKRPFRGCQREIAQIDHPNKSKRNTRRRRFPKLDRKGMPERNTRRRRIPEIDRKGKPERNARRRRRHK